MQDWLPILWVSTIAGLATTLGSLVVLMFGRPKEQVLAMLLAGAGGVMLAVVSLDLLPTAWQIGPLSQVILGFIIGLAFMKLADQKLNASPPSLPLPRRQRLKRIGLLVAAGIALHDLPEGMAIALGQEATEDLGVLIAMAITLHNLPEGMATTAPLKMAGIKSWKILLLNFGIAFFTPFGALIGLLAIDSVQNSLSFFLALAGGAMAFLVFAELWPLSRERHPRYALLGGVLGYLFFAGISFLH
ncbi:ZIP family zinc transporter [Desulfitobacterium sp. LBE]|uniref:ZIP Zinc transporter protein n=4 Tax=root TaxID=1 RepID=A0A098B3G3_DESHA|nr:MULTISPECIES: ZIP family metal transporter [Desulfitobacterium]ACL22415.1 zinc/iron permease [Desulfitobacterium hafniense DCB-2]EHL04171.1 metal cation transporter, ZIP family [Desulfitobacterium hafniense DP7]MEA5023962.1 ZIP family metal transporter [Desulfitobacterium hafniense]TWH59801.1 ZIP family zinc transporter [Desulfitobacterium sp. LBE]CDX03379.1 ZIP Zinc transporter protein [Desulfitobacterium hafniense]